MPSSCMEASSLVEVLAGDSRMCPIWTPLVVPAFWIAVLASATTEALESFAGSRREASISFFTTRTFSS